MESLRGEDAFLCSTSISPFHTWSLRNPHDQMQFFILHSLGVFSDHSGNESEKKSWVSGKIDDFLYVLAKHIFRIFIGQNRVSEFFHIYSFLELSQLYQTMYKNQRQTILLDFWITWILHEYDISFFLLMHLLISGGPEKKSQFFFIFL